MNSDLRQPDYDLTCWYINARRVIELVGAQSISSEMRSLPALTDIDDNLRNLAASEKSTHFGSVAFEELCLVNIALYAL